MQSKKTRTDVCWRVQVVCGKSFEIVAVKPEHKPFHIRLPLVLGSADIFDAVTKLLHSLGMVPSQQVLARYQMHLEFWRVLRRIVVFFSKCPKDLPAQFELRTFRLPTSIQIARASASGAKTITQTAVFVVPLFLLLTWSLRNIGKELAAATETEKKGKEGEEAAAEQKVVKELKQMQANVMSTNHGLTVRTPQVVIDTKVHPELSLLIIAMDMLQPVVPVSVAELMKFVMSLIALVTEGQRFAYVLSNVYVPGFQKFKNAQDKWVWAAEIGRHIKKFPSNVLAYVAATSTS